MSEEQKSSGLEALANAASLGENASDPGASCGAITTKHPRHRPGCSCIVCIQPPSGKGKHKPMCNCNVCLTVKRRFKTLMMRKKKRQSEQEAELARKNHQIHHGQTDEAEVDSQSTTHSGIHLESSPLDSTEPTLTNDSGRLNAVNKLTDGGKELDLNFGPEGGADLQVGLPRVTMTSLLQLASLPLESYMKQSGLTSLASEQQVSKETESPADKDHCIARIVQAQDELDGQRGMQEQGQTVAQ